MAMGVQQYITQAERLIGKGDIKRAVEYLQQALVEDPGSAEAHLLLADCYVALGKEKRALSTLYQLLANDPDNKKAQAGISIIKLSSVDTPTSPAPQASKTVGHTSQAPMSAKPAPVSSATPTAPSTSKKTSTVRTANPTTAPPKPSAQQQPSSATATFSSVTPAHPGSYYDFSYRALNNTIYLKLLYNGNLEVVEPVEHLGWHGYTKPYGKVVIPSHVMVQGLTVYITSIGPDAFKNCYDLSEIVIASSITIIKASAFENCTSLKEVLMPNSVTALGKEVFKGCVSLEKVNMSRQIRSFQSGLFDQCRSLKTVKVGKGMRNEFLKNNSIPTSSPFTVEEYNTHFWQTAQGRKNVSFHDDSGELDVTIKFLLVMSGIAGFLLMTSIGVWREWGNWFFLLDVLLPCQYIYWSVEWHSSFDLKLAGLTTLEKRRRRRKAILFILGFWAVVTILLIITKPFAYDIEAF